MKKFSSIHWQYLEATSPIAMSSLRAQTLSSKFTNEKYQILEKWLTLGLGQVKIIPEIKEALRTHV